MRRAATLSRVSPAAVLHRHGAYLGRWYREHELGHNDGLNRLVARLARQGVAVAAGWRGEVNVPDVTQVRPDLLVPVVAGPTAAGTTSWSTKGLADPGAWKTSCGPTGG